MSRTAAVGVDPQPFAAVCELHVWSDAFLSWLVLRVMVRMVVPDGRNLVLSFGLSVVIFRYWAAAGPARHKREQRVMNRSSVFTGTSSGQRSVARALGGAADETKDGSEWGASVGTRHPSSRWDRR